MLFCVYIPTLYALNFLVFTSENRLGVLMAIIMLLVSLILFLIGVYLWQFLLKKIYSKLAQSLTKQAILGVILDWLLITIALCLAFLSDSRLWNTPSLLISDNSRYMTNIIMDTLGKISAIWIFIYSAICFAFTPSK